jgi:hypothetical protein
MVHINTNVIDGLFVGDVIDGFVVGKSRQMSCCYPQTTHGVADSKL